jgi:hypothetical protein
MLRYKYGVGYLELSQIVAFSVDDQHIVTVNWKTNFNI